jgi:hypothetical protein
MGETIMEQEIEEPKEEVYYCPLCESIHEFSVPCFHQLDKKFRESLMKEFRIIKEMDSLN